MTVLLGGNCEYLVCNFVQIVLTPIELAIEDIQKKTKELEHAVNQVK